MLSKAIQADLHHDGSRHSAHVCGEVNMGSRRIFVLPRNLVYNIPLLASPKKKNIRCTRGETEGARYLFH